MKNELMNLIKPRKLKQDKIKFDQRHLTSTKVESSVKPVTRRPEINKILERIKSKKG